MNKTLLTLLCERGMQVAVKKNKGESPVVGFRCPPEVILRIDKLVAQYAKRIGVPVTRSIVIVRLVEQGLEAEGRKAKR